jgi:cytochrome c-type biogenesis protein
MLIEPLLSRPRWCGQMLAAALALLAGILTVAAPCTLPVLPVILGASVGQTSRARPLFIGLGFVTAFSVTALIFSAITQIIGIDQNTLRTSAIALLLVFGFLMLWPLPFEKFSAYAAGLIKRQDQTVVRTYSGNAGGLVLGTTLGLVWTPCAGPVLGSILTLIATSTNVAWEAVLLVVYAIGAAVPMLAIAYGGQFITGRVRGIARISHRLQQGFGALVIAFAIAMYFQYDTILTVWLSNLYLKGQVGL